MAQPTKIFVGSLPPGTKPEELRRLFENYGVVVECDVMNRCGFVHMKNAAMADNAIVSLNASEFKGQTIVVEYGRAKERKQVSGRNGNQGSGGCEVVGPRGSREGGGMGRGIVGFSGRQNPKHFNEAATLQLAGVIMGLLGDQQNQFNNDSGSSNIEGGSSVYLGFRRSGEGSATQKGKNGSFQSGKRGVNRNVNGIGPMRNQGFRSDRSVPYPQSVNNAHHGGGSVGGNRCNNQVNGVGRSGGGPRGNFNNNSRGGNFAPRPASKNYGGNYWNNDQRGRNFVDDNLSRGFSGNMGNMSNDTNFGGKQDRRGFTLPSNQFQKYGSQIAGYASGDGGVSFSDDVFQRRNINQQNMGGRFPEKIDGGRDGGGVSGGFQNNRSGQGFQQASGFKRGGQRGNNNTFSDNYQEQFPPLGAGQRGFGNNRGRIGQIGRGNGGSMNRIAPRHNMPNRRY